MTNLFSASDELGASALASSAPGKAQGQGQGQEEEGEEPNKGRALGEEGMTRQCAGGERSREKRGAKLAQDLDPGPFDECREAATAAAAAAAAAESSKGSQLKTQRSRPRPRQSPASPPPAYLYPPSTAAAAGAGSGARAGSLRPSVSGILAGNFFEDSSQERNDRATSLGDRYKGNHNRGYVRRQEQQQHDCVSTGNRVYRAGERSAERFRERGGSTRRSRQQPLRHGPSRTAAPYSAAAGASRALGADGSGTTAAAAVSATGVEMEDQRGGIGASGGRRRKRENASRTRQDGVGEGHAGGRDEEQNQGQEGNGRVAQIAEGLLWVQKHPVLAAVIWMCGKVLDPGSEASQQETEASTATTATTVTTFTAAEGGSTGAEDGDSSHAFEDSSDPMPGMTGDFEQGRIVPPGFWRRHSKGRLSWSDDYQGGCLAEYYEDERAARLASGASSVDAEASGQQQQQQQQHQAGPSASKVITAATAVASSRNRCCIGCRQHASHREGGEITAATTCTSSTGAEMGEADGCERCSGKTGEDFGDAAAAPGSDRINARTARASDIGVIESAYAGGREGGDNDDDDGDEVFHSALQLAVAGDCSDGEDPGDVEDVEATEDLTGIVVGCGARVVEHGTFYGTTRDASGDETHGGCIGQTGIWERGPAGGAAPSEDGCVPTSHERAQDTADALATSGPNDGNAAGTPNSAAGAGTWSPQWGWYVTMTPPQDQYPAQQNPIPGVKLPTPTASTESPDTPTSIEGRPPRP